jgi:hypothetical protein
MKPLVALFALALGVPGLAMAQQPITKAATVRATATIQAIDATTRTVTLRMKDGQEDSFTASPEMARFNELKVGQTIDFTYTESLVVQVRKPGAPGTGGTTGNAALTTSSGAQPGATLGAQLQTTVTVKAIDPAVPSITVATTDGRTVTRKIDNKKNLEGVTVGDQLAITYTQALLMSVAPAK